MLASQAIFIKINLIYPMRKRTGWLTEWKKYKPEMFTDEALKVETWYAVSWNEIYFTPQGKMQKRHHQFHYQTKAGAEKVVANLRIHQQSGRVDNVQMTALHFERPVQGLPRRES